MKLDVDICSACYLPIDWHLTALDGLECPPAPPVVVWRNGKRAERSLSDVLREYVGRDEHYDLVSALFLDSCAERIVHLTATPTSPHPITIFRADVARDDQ